MGIGKQGYHCVGCRVIVQELDVSLGRGPRRNITRGSFFGAATSALWEPELSKVDDTLVDGEVVSETCSGFSSWSFLAFTAPLTTRIVLREGEGAGLPLLLFVFRSRSVIEMGVVTGVFREGGEAVSKVDNISSVRSSQGSTELEFAVLSDCLPPRRFFVAFSSWKVQVSQSV
jgi:hypothetical protein